VTEKVDSGSTPFGTFGIKNIDSDVFIHQQGIAGSSHEKGCVQVEDAFIEEYIADSKDIPQQYDDELEHQHQKAAPENRISDIKINGFQKGDSSFHGSL
jgi:hypothetical protein